MKMQSIICPAVALAIAPIAANAVTATYDFTGTVTSVTGIYSSLISQGETITGTYTLDYSSANPAQTTGTVGSTTPNTSWSLNSTGGSAFGTPPPSALVFSSTAQVGSVSYATSPLQLFADTSAIRGSAGPLVGVNATNQFTASEDIATDAGDHTTSVFQFIYPTSTSEAYSSDGLPIFIPNSSIDTTGHFEKLINNTPSDVAYRINTFAPVSPVPLPGAFWLLLSGLGGLGALARRRKGG